MKARGRDVARTPECRCLNCGARLDAVGTGDPAVEAHPLPGDVTVCIRCGAVMKLDDALRLRGMSEVEMDELVNDKEWMDQVAKIVRAVYFIKHIDG